jgi:uncharacterized membrane protein (UPF0127 family)
MRRITVINATKAAIVGARIEVADTFSSRLLGLLGRGGLAPGRGLLIEPSSGIHTFGMSFAIDVVGTWRAVAPCRVAGLGLKTRSCLELAAGEIDRRNIEVGDRLEIVQGPRGDPWKSAGFQEFPRPDDKVSEPGARAIEGES